jgi:hypothetical protein
MSEELEIKEQRDPSRGDAEAVGAEEPLDEGEELYASVSLLLHNYLQSDKGHEIAKQVLELVKDIKRSTLDRNVEQDKANAEQARLREERLHRFYGWVLVSQNIVFALTILTASILTYMGKFDSTLAVLFGTLVGYFFGRKTSSKGD